MGGQQQTLKPTENPACGGVGHVYFMGGHACWHAEMESYADACFSLSSYLCLMNEMGSKPFVFMRLVLQWVPPHGQRPFSSFRAH